MLSFAYPFGLTSRAAADIVAQTFQSACSTSLRRAGAEPLHRLSRVDMYYIRTLDSLKRLVLGQLDPYLTARRWMRLVRGSLIAGR